MTLQELHTHLETFDEGILRRGHHAPGREACALEFESQVRQRAWSDRPLTLPDLRPLNDGPWSSDQARTQALLPVMAALWEWSTWTAAQQRIWATRVVIDTVQQIVSQLPDLSDALRAQCQRAETRRAVWAADDAAEVADAVAWATKAAGAAGAAGARADAAGAAGAARAAAKAAVWAAEAAEAAAADRVLMTACAIWINAAQAR